MQGCICLFWVEICITFDENLEEDLGRFVLILSVAWGLSLFTCHLSLFKGSTLNKATFSWLFVIISRSRCSFIVLKLLKILSHSEIRPFKQALRTSATLRCHNYTVFTLSHTAVVGKTSVELMWSTVGGAYSGLREPTYQGRLVLSVGRPQRDSSGEWR